MSGRKSSRAEPADVQYCGLAGDSNECQDAVLRLIQYGDRISMARILSFAKQHALLLTVGVGDLVAIRSGFASGYRGQGSRTLSYVLQVLDAHGAEIDEYQIDEAFLARLDSALLTSGDLTTLDALRPVRPSRWHDYQFEEDEGRKANGTLWREFPPLIPFAIVDPRLADLALAFWSSPDERLLAGYRRLEGIVRKRTGVRGSGQKLFAQVFLGSTPVLSWGADDPAEQVGMGNLFVSAFMAHRNPRAHRELDDDPHRQLSEFLLLNHLFRLEGEAQAP
jgi:hypothetical protein